MATMKDDKTKAPVSRTVETDAPLTETSSAAPIAETFGGSPVTSDISGVQSNEREIDLGNAKITVSQDAIKNAPVETAVEVKPFVDNSVAGRANLAGIGLVRVDGIDFRYVGLAPARDKEAKTPAGLMISSANSTFTPLSEVTFDQSVRVKDPKSGEFYFPTEVTGWGDVELNGSYLVPKVEAVK